MKIVWSPTARRCAEAAVDFIALDRPRTAIEWFGGLIQRVELLRDLPDQGRHVPEWGEPSVREILYEPYRVVYEIAEDRIEILVLSHVRQQFPSKRPEGSL